MGAMKIACITAVFGGFDNIKEIPGQTIPFDRHVFTEENSPYPMCGLDNRLKAKLFKMCPHLVLPGYDCYIWVDGNVQIKSHRFVEMMTEPISNGCDVVISKHPSRNTIEEEANYIIRCIRSGDRYLSSRYNPDAIEWELNECKKTLLKKELYWCGLFARANNCRANAVFDTWFKSNVLGSNFDQLNFVSDVASPPVLLLNSIDFGPFYENEIYKLSKHNKVA